MTTSSLSAVSAYPELSFALVERDLVPDPILRAAIRGVLAKRLAELSCGVEQEGRREAEFVARMRTSPVTLHTREANEQHYELPTAFFELVLGPHLKYSCCEYADGETDYAESLGAAEARMLDRTIARLGLTDGERVLEIGCGWGSLTLRMAERFPGAEVVAVSNSRTQRAHIERVAAARGLTNVRVVTADVATLDFTQLGTFDRVVSVEMFEHARNWSSLFERVASVMRPRATFFLHVFTHRAHSYPYEPSGPTDFIARHFFTGGMMPSDHLVYRAQDALRVTSHERVSGTHYQKTAEAWLVRMDRNREPIRRIFAQVYGEGEVTRWWVRWRIFFLSCAELWGYRGGDEWHVSHYLLEKP